ncbi:acyl-CoA dehydrogenase family protein [Prauserella oleivorans]|uniref:Acyl-CoA dehydrogenase family protein n=1 Tax=Prauserella oleivorans TaxID=1478153 RepID=A0ABW5WE25_9PSEU
MTGDPLAAALDRVVRPHTRECDKRGRFPRGGLAALAGAGVLGCTVARELGGGGLWLREAADVVRRVARVCASTATVLQAHLTAVAVLEEHGPRGLRAEIATGRHLVTIAGDLVEPAGTAVRRGTVADLYGRHPWVAAAAEADSYVWVEGDGVWLVPASAPGLLVPAETEPLGLRGAAAAPVAGDPVSVPVEALLTTCVPGAVRDVALPWFTVLGAAVSLGIMDSAIETTAAAVRAPGVRPRGALLAELARMQVRADSVRALFTETADAVAWRERDVHRAVLALRFAAVQTAIGVTDLAMKVCQAGAGSGVADVERRFRDARAAYAVPPTPDTVLEHLGAVLYGS